MPSARLRPRCYAASGLVLADEPTGALDDAHATAVIDILREMSGAGCAVVPATHDAAVRDRGDAVFAVHEYPGPAGRATSRMWWAWPDPEAQAQAQAQAQAGRAFRSRTASRCSVRPPVTASTGGPEPQPVVRVRPRRGSRRSQWRCSAAGLKASVSDIVKPWTVPG